VEAIYSILIAPALEGSRLGSPPLPRASASKGVIQNLLDIQQTSCPGYNFNWDQVLGELAELEYGPWYNTRTSPKTSAFSPDAAYPRVSVQLVLSIFETPWLKTQWQMNGQAYFIHGTEFDGEEWRTET